jgi:prolyl 4-hydroxylase
LTKIGRDHGEEWQVVKYQPGGFYKEHWDYFDPAFEGNKPALQAGGQRILTILVYLATVKKGGETFFPSFDLKVQPKAGRAVLWRNVLADGSLNTKTIHSGLPPENGEKWIATKWLRERSRFLPQQTVSYGL